MIWLFLISLGGTLKCTTTEDLKLLPREENFQAFSKKVKRVVNNSNYGAKEKACSDSPRLEKLSQIL